MFGSIFKKVKAFLRLRKKTDAVPRLIPFDEVMFDLENNTDPWYTRIYWAVYRFFRWHKIFHPTEMYREAKWFIQRGRRGWADCDTWSLDSYLDGFMPDALRHLKEHKHGVPCGMFEGLPTNEHGYHDDEYYKVAESRWNAVMDKMIAAFEASRRMQDGFQASEVLRKRDMVIFEEGMKLFAEHYHSLWD